MDAIITAGGRISGEFAETTGVTLKALLNLGGRTLLQRTIAAVRGAGCVDRVCVVGPEDVRGAALDAGADLFVEERLTGVDNVLRGLDALDARGRVLVAASDLPFLRPEDIDEFVRRTPPLAMLSYGVFTRQEWEKAYPDAHRPFIPCADGEFTGGCVLLVDAQTVRRLEPVCQRAFAARKSQFGMARLLGPALVLRLLLGKVMPRLGATSEAARRRVEAIVGCSCALVRGCSPRLAADVDLADEWKHAQQVAAQAAVG